MASGPWNNFKLPIMWNRVKTVSPIPVRATRIFDPTLDSTKSRKKGPLDWAGSISAGPLGWRSLLVVDDIIEGVQCNRLISFCNSLLHCRNERKWLWHSQRSFELR